MPTEWEEIDDDRSVGFLQPCDGAAGPRDRDDCRERMTVHGHVLIGDCGLTGRVPFPCESREGIAALLKVLLADWHIDGHMERTLLGLASVRALPVEMTDAEREILEDPTSLARMTDYLLRLR